MREPTNPAWYFVAALLLLVAIPLALAYGSEGSPLGLVPVAVGLLVLPYTRRRIMDATDTDLSEAQVRVIAVVGLLLLPAMFVYQDALIHRNPGDVVGEASIDARDAPAGAEGSLAVRFNARAQVSVDAPGEGGVHRAPPYRVDRSDAGRYGSVREVERGGMYVVVRMEVTNTGDDTVTLSRNLFALYSRSGDEYGFADLEGTPSLEWRSEVTLTPGESHDGRVVFYAPRGNGQFRLLTNRSGRAAEVGVTFRHDESLSIDLLLAPEDR